MDRATGQLTFDQLMSKPRRIVKLDVTLPSDDNEEGKVYTMKFQALTGDLYDKLLAEHPPTKTEVSEGLTYHADSFGPALIAACSYSPSMSLDQAKALWNNDAWSAGERANMMFVCIGACNAGLNLPFNAGA
jgi:hypothetical protein